jgi:hypothetical protein
VYTSPNKGVVSEAYGPLTDWSYLKNTFRLEDTVWYAQLDRSVIWEICKWTRISDDDFESTVLNCNTALRFAFMHGLPFFSLLRNILFRALCELERPFYLLQWGDVHEWFVADNFDILVTPLDLNSWDLAVGRDAEVRKIFASAEALS